MFNLHNRTRLLLSLLFITNSASAMGVVSLGEICFRIRDPNNGNILRRLMKLEVTHSGTQNYTLSGVVKNANNNVRYWVSGSSHQLSGPLPPGVGSWFSGQLHGVKDITNDEALVAVPYHVALTHPLPLNSSLSKFRDTVGFSDVYTMELSSCADLDFQNLYNNEFPQ